MKKWNEIAWGSILFLYGLTVLAILVLRHGSLGIGTIALTAVAAFCVLGFGLLPLLLRGRSGFSPDRGFVLFLFPLALLVLTAATPGPPGISGIVLSPPGGSRGAAYASPGSPAVKDPDVDAFVARLLDEEDPIVFDETSYFHLHDALTRFPELAAGRGVRIDGFLSLGGPEGPMIGRYLLWCCGSDAVFLGMSLDGELPTVPEGTWLVVTGRLSMSVGRERGNLIRRSVISVEETRIIDEPEFVYILPF